MLWITFRKEASFNVDAGVVMGIEHHPEMKGFDSYELTLGDELRGERASKGKSLLLSLIHI